MLTVFIWRFFLKIWSVHDSITFFFNIPLYSRQTNGKCCACSFCKFVVSYSDCNCFKKTGHWFSMKIRNRRTMAFQTNMGWSTFMSFQHSLATKYSEKIVFFAAENFKLLSNVQTCYSISSTFLKHIERYVENIVLNMCKHSFLCASWRLSSRKMA